MLIPRMGNFFFYIMVSQYNSFFKSGFEVEMFYLNFTLNFGIPPVLLFQLEVYYRVDRLVTGVTVQQKGTTVRWYSNISYVILLDKSVLNNMCL